MNRFKNILNNIGFNLSDYWTHISYNEKSNVYEFKVSNKTYTIGVTWYEKHAPIGKVSNKYILEMGKIETGQLVMTHMITEIFGEIFNSDTELISYVYSILKDDKEFIKYLRKNKLEKIVD